MENRSHGPLFKERWKDLLFQQPLIKPGSKLPVSNKELSWKSNFCSSKRPVVLVQLVKANVRQFQSSVISAVMEMTGEQGVGERRR